MKKIISILLALVTLLALAVPALAVTTFTGNQTINGGNYPDGIALAQGATLTIEGTVEISGMLELDGNCTLIISRNAKLIGKDLAVYMQGENKIEIYGINDGNTVTDGTQGEINITTNGEGDTSRLTTVLSGCINYTQDGNHIVVGCLHGDITNKSTTETTTETTTTTTTTTQVTTTTTTKVYCKDCEAVVHTEVTTKKGKPQVTTTTSTDGGAGSALSEGNMTVVLCVACSAVFLVVGFVLGRRKLKTAE